jgi:hypothetical protein
VYAMTPALACLLMLRLKEFEFSGRLAVEKRYWTGTRHISMSVQSMPS